MTSKPGVERYTGILCLVFAVVAVTWYLIVPDRDVSLTGISATLSGISENSGRYLGFLSVDILYNMLVFALGIMFFSILRTFNRPLALFGLMGLAATGIMWMLVDMQDFALYGLAQQFVKATGAQADAIAASASAIALPGDYSANLVATFYGVGLLAFGAIIATKSPLPRLLGSWAIVSGLLMLVSWYNLGDTGLFDIAFYLSEAWFFATGLWLIAKGIRQEPARESVS